MRWHQNGGLGSSLALLAAGLSGRRRRAGCLGRAAVPLPQLSSTQRKPEIRKPPIVGNCPRGKSPTSSWRLRERRAAVIWCDRISGRSGWIFRGRFREAVIVLGIIPVSGPLLSVAGQIKYAVGGPVFRERHDLVDLVVDSRFGPFGRLVAPWIAAAVGRPRRHFPLCLGRDLFAGPGGK